MKRLKKEAVETSHCFYFPTNRNTAFVKKKKKRTEPLHNSPVNN